MPCMSLWLASLAWLFVLMRESGELVTRKLVCRRIVRLLTIDKNPRTSCLSRIETMVMMELVEPLVDDREFRFGSGFLLRCKHCNPHILDLIIKHWWFSGKIGRCHPRSSDLKCRPAPGSIPGRCIEQSSTRWYILLLITSSHSWSIDGCKRRTCSFGHGIHQRRPIAFR
jgi:hypothetical protein